MVGVPKEKSGPLREDIKSIYIGTEAHLKAGVLDIRHPIQGGVFSDWDDLERLWSCTCQVELRTDLPGPYIFMTDSPMSPQVDRKKIITTPFETFNIAGAYVGNSAVMALYASGRTSSLVLGSGYYST